MNYNIKYDDATKACRDAAEECGLEFKRFDPNDVSSWYGTAFPYIDFFTANHLRQNEMRTGHNNMPISKENGKMKSLPVEKYGINTSHHMQMEGSTYLPEKRSSMAQSVGPLTALLCHIRS